MPIDLPPVPAEVLRPWLKHDESCGWRSRSGCNCGLDDALASLPAAPKPPTLTEEEAKLVADAKAWHRVTFTVDGDIVDSADPGW